MKASATLKVFTNAYLHECKGFDRNGKLILGKLLVARHNKTLNGGLDLFAQLIMQKGGYTLPNYSSIGTGTTAITSADIKLTTETYRLPFTTTDIPTIGQIVCQTFYPLANCGVHIHEMGLWGNGATSTPDSGTIIARVLADYDNSGSPVDLVLTWASTLASSD